MNQHQMDYLGAKLQVLESAVVALLRGAKLTSVADEVEAASSQIQPPTLRREPQTKTDEHRAKISEGATKAWEKRREDLKLFLFEYQNEEPSRLDYEEAARKLGYSAGTLRVRVSQAPHHAVVFYKSGRHLVLARAADGLETALRAKFNETKNPDDLVSLPARTKKAGVR